MSVYFRVSNILPDTRVEMPISLLSDFTIAHNFRSSVEIAIVERLGTFLVSPSYWAISSTSSFIHDPNVMTYSGMPSDSSTSFVTYAFVLFITVGLDLLTFQSILSDLKQITVQKMNSAGVMKTYLITPLLLND